jgi:energy-coupling factor transport system ATP-binding protein
LDIFETSKLAGTVLQDTDDQFVGLSCAEDIAFALENDNTPSIEMRARVAEAAALVGMKPHLEKSPHELSGGQKQRVSMAGVLVDNVDILLFDEPLANLDPAAGKDAIELIDDLHKKTGKTIIIVEHRLEDVLHRPVDRVIVIDKGRVIADMKPAELLASALLKEIGIREPLYISALRYSGINITENMAPESLCTLNIDYGPLVSWCEGKLGIKNEKPIQNIEENILEIKDLHFTYSEHNTRALKGISFSIPAGGRVALVGKNGSGKSTLAKCICGFITPDSGSILFKGKDLSSLSIMERAEHIGYVMQNPNQMISFPMIYDEMAFGLKMRRMADAEIKERAHEALQVCGLYSFRNWPVSALSYGQKKRLTIASILALRPSFMILDEPTAGQDYRSYTEFMEFLAKLNEERGISFLIITHDMHLMLEYATKAVVLSDGYCIANQQPFEALTDDVIIKEANLKRTSLYDLALKAGITQPRDFVGNYISFERKKRGEKT